jgi:hypothetical protein
MEEIEGSLAGARAARESDGFEAQREAIGQSTVPPPHRCRLERHSLPPRVSSRRRSGMTSRRARARAPPPWPAPRRGARPVGPPSTAKGSRNRGMSDLIFGHRDGEECLELQLQLCLERLQLGVSRHVVLLLRLGDRLPEVDGRELDELVHRIRDLLGDHPVVRIHLLSLRCLHDHAGYDASGKDDVCLDLLGLLLGFGRSRRPSSSRPIPSEQVGSGRPSPAWRPSLSSAPRRGAAYPCRDPGGADPRCPCPAS